MSRTPRPLRKIDDSLLLRLAALPPGGQRWLKTALEAIAILEPFVEGEEKEELAAPPRRAGRPGLDEVLRGGAEAREQAELHPELAEDLRGIAEIADLLRDIGRERRRLGEDILRESETEEDENGSGG